MEERDAERGIWLREISIAWYRLRKCETQVGAVWETLGESFDGLMDPSKVYGGWIEDWLLDQKA